MSGVIIKRLEDGLNVAAGEVCAEIRRLNASGERTSTRLEISRGIYETLKGIGDGIINTESYDEKINGYEKMLK